MIVYLGGGAIAATGAVGAGPSDEVGTNCIPVTRPSSPPAYFKSDVAVVTKASQFREFYRWELESGQPLGLHVAAVRR